MRTLLCCIGRQENKYIREFVEYYKNLGFTNICLYDNNREYEERFEDVIGDYVVDAEGNTVEVGYIPRPTDQRFAFNLFFQDHIPGYPQFRVHLNFVFASGLPFGPPNAPAYQRQFRTTWYRRVDMGFSFMLLEQSRDRMRHKSAFIRSIKNAGIYLEVFNVLGTSNVSSFIWITDLYNVQYPMPNFLTGRLINVKLAVEW